MQLLSCSTQSEFFMEEIIKAYLQGLRNGLAEPILQLFADKAIVYSPLYGAVEAGQFYTDLFEDSSASVIQLHDIFTNETNRSASVYFTYHWTMADGQISQFDCVDVFNFDAEGKIKSLRIIYDTATTRSAFDKLKNQTDE